MAVWRFCTVIPLRTTSWGNCGSASAIWFCTAAAVAAPIEQQLSGLDGLLYFKSSNSSAGVMNLSVYFDISRNPDLSALHVQNQLALADPQLPPGVVDTGIPVH